jgi:diacylglycerol kinase
MRGKESSLNRRIVERLLLFVAEDPVSGKPGKHHSFRRSLRNALKGLVFAFLSDRNFRFELAVFCFALLLATVLRISALEWLLVIQSGLLVLALEAKNTALELSVDLSTPGYHYGAKGSKDAAAGAVLLAALNALIVGLVVFGPRLLAVASGMISHFGASL